MEVHIFLSFATQGSQSRLIEFQIKRMRAYPLAMQMSIAPTEEQLL